MTITTARAELSLSQLLKGDADMLKGVSGLFKFAAGLATGEPFTLTKGLAELGEAAASALEGSSALAARIGRPSDPKKDFKSAHEKFCILFFVTCQRCYIEALSDYTAAIATSVATKKVSLTPDTKEEKRLSDRLQSALANLNEAEVSFRFGIDPMSGQIPLFDAFDAWLLASLEYLGYSIQELPAPISACNKNARERFRVWLAQDTEEAQWTRNYLALTREETAADTSRGELAQLNEVLRSWVEIAKKGERKRAELWRGYRSSLMDLPDQKESMFSEDFGVRKVFVPPLATYHIAGARGDTGKPSEISDLGRVLGALLSSRVKSDDLIVLCGGPGSGKSTLCRIMASQLAANPDVHPVFVRLRRLKEGAEVASFVEEMLRREGLIERSTDIKTIPSLILILDGFDELVMASRARLRQFFNVLREDHSSGILRNAKIVVSGRDTLFPKGEGLPSGSHVLNLVPFDPPRVKLWAEKWRALDSSESAGDEFHPEELLTTGSERRKKSPLQHLLTWPLTLHLVARVHSTGRLSISKDKSDEIEKAYLYRSILADTATRQLDQAEGKGRLDSKQMRRFLQVLAWEMHTRAVDCMDVADVMPILRIFFPGSQDGDLMDLAEVAVVNSPELTKGEETGFEFVHKSFAEYLAAEEIAISIEHSTFMSTDFMADEPSWRMSQRDAAIKLGGVFGVRLLTDEVQEMLEPMLGGFESFLKGERVSDRVDALQRVEGVNRIVLRFGALLREALQGKLLSTVHEAVHQRIYNPLESYANFCAGLVLIGSAAARASRALNRESKSSFQINPFENAFWRLVSILVAGGLVLDAQLSKRLFMGSSVGAPAEYGKSLNIPIPFKLNSFNMIGGFRNQTELALTGILDQAFSMAVISNVLLAFSVPINSQLASELASPNYARWAFREIEEFHMQLGEMGLIERKLNGHFSDSFRAIDELRSLIWHSRGSANEKIREEKIMFVIERLLRHSRLAKPKRDLQYLVHEILTRLDDQTVHAGEIKTKKPPSR